jgi:hypothetical protein
LAASSTRFGGALLLLGEGLASSERDSLLLSKTLEQRTQVDPELKPWLLVDELELGKAPPFLWVMVAPGAMWSEDLGEKLRRYIARGGTLMVEMSHAAAQPLLAELRAQVFPDKSLGLLRSDALLTRTFYILPPESARALGTISSAGRVVWVETTRPLLKGLAQSAAQREQRLRACINIVLYALTGSYKDDLTHLKFLMRRKKQ